MLEYCRKDSQGHSETNHFLQPSTSFHRVEALVTTIVSLWPSPPNSDIRIDAWHFSHGSETLHRTCQGHIQGETAHIREFWSMAKSSHKKVLKHDWFQFHPICIVTAFNIIINVDSYSRYRYIWIWIMDIYVLFESLLSNSFVLFKSDLYSKRHPRKVHVLLNFGYPRNQKIQTT